MKLGRWGKSAFAVGAVVLCLSLIAFLLAAGSPKSSARIAVVEEHPTPTGMSVTLFIPDPYIVDGTEICLLRTGDPYRDGFWNVEADSVRTNGGMKSWFWFDKRTNEPVRFRVTIIRPNSLPADVMERIRGFRRERYLYWLRNRTYDRRHPMTNEFVLFGWSQANGSQLRDGQRPEVSSHE